MEVSRVNSSMLSCINTILDSPETKLSYTILASLTSSVLWRSKRVEYMAEFPSPKYTSCLVFHIAPCSNSGSPFWRTLSCMVRKNGYVEWKYHFWAGKIKKVVALDYLQNTSRIGVHQSYHATQVSRKQYCGVPGFISGEDFSYSLSFFVKDAVAHHLDKWEFLMAEEAGVVYLDLLLGIESLPVRTDCASWSNSEEAESRNEGKGRYISRENFADRSDFFLLVIKLGLHHILRVFF